MTPELLEQYQKQFGCGFPQAKELFPACVADARQKLTETGLNSYLDSAKFLCNMGRGVEPVLIYLHEMPDVAVHLGEQVLQQVKDYGYKLARSPNKNALIPFLQTLPAVCRRIDTAHDFNQYLAMIDDFVEKTATVIHGHQSMYESPGLVELLDNMPKLLGKLTLEGIRNFIQYGVRNYRHAPDQQKEYFDLASPDARSIIARERHGTVFKDAQRHLEMLQQIMWDSDLPFVTYSTSMDQLINPMPYIDEQAMRLPDVYDDLGDISGIDRYRAALAHMLAHKQWSSQLLADNFAPHMQLFISTFEDARVERLAMQRYPGLKKLWLGLHPIPPKGDCDSEKMACLRYRATRLSRALIDENFDAEDDVIRQHVAQFNALLAEKGEQSSIKDMQELGASYYVKTRLMTDSLPDVYFAHTDISYRDDNRCLWIHHEEYDEADEVIKNEYQSDEAPTLEDGLPPRHYDEWDYLSESYRPDWCAVYERLNPSGDAGKVDKLLTKHDSLIKRIKRLVEMLRPQNKKRIRFQEEGSELDLDVALRSILDYKSGSNPDPRINYSHTTDGRSISVMLLVDMSQSLNQMVANSNQTLLELSEEALAIMSFTVELLGDKFAIAGFHSDTRHDVRYHHIKGWSEHWGEEVKARIAGMKAQYSTRMGAAMRHAAHYLELQKSEKKLLLILTDGEPADIDSKDPQTLIQDTKKAVSELAQKGIYSYCINMDPKADDYVADIFGNHYSVIDKLETLPQKLPEIFIALTK